MVTNIRRKFDMHVDIDYVNGNRIRPYDELC
jgi:hypothetical protein